ncbi:MAG: 50S ribosomal protein L25 [Pirellulales bacterium]
MSESLEVVARHATGSHASRRLRRQGLIPIVLYGHGEKCVDLAAHREAVEAVIRHGSRVVELKGAVKTSALVRELQWDTFGNEPLHVDLIRVNASERVKVRVPVDLKGECPGQREGGVVTVLVHEVDLECTADAIPERIHGFVGRLGIGGTIKVRDLDLPKGVRVLADDDETLVSCALPSKKAEEAAVVAEPELIGRKPTEEGAAAETE